MTDQSPPEKPPSSQPRLGEIGLTNYAPYLMNRIMGRYNASLRDEMAGLGLTTPKMRALAVLSVIDGPLIRELSVYSVVEQSTLSRALGWWGAYMPLGTATALLCGAPLLELIGWRPVWLFLALLTFLAAIGLATQVSYDPTHARGTGSVVGTKALKPWTRVRLTLVAPGPWLVALAFFLYSGQWLAVVGFLPTIYSEAGYSGVVVGVLTALAAGINMVGGDIVEVSPPYDTTGATAIAGAHVAHELICLYHWAKTQR